MGLSDHSEGPLDQGYQLILVEGNHGTGKSTFARLLCERLRSEGRQVSLFDEYENECPIDTWSIQMMRKGPLEQRQYLSGDCDSRTREFLKQRHDKTRYTASQWLELTDRLEASPEQVMIFSGTFWQNCLMPFFFHDASLQQLLDEQRTLVSVMVPASPLLVYFSTTDPLTAHCPLTHRGGLLESMLLNLYGVSFWSRRHTRGMNIEENGRAYLQSWQGMLDQLYGDFAGEKQRFPDVWKNWAEMQSVLDTVTAQLL